MDLIDRDEIRKFPIRWDHYDMKNGSPHFINGVETVMEYIEEIPAVEKDDNWYYMPSEGEVITLTCPKCGARVNITAKIQYNFCFSCGAAMERENGKKDPDAKTE